MRYDHYIGVVRRQRVNVQGSKNLEFQKAVHLQVVRNKNSLSK